MKKFIKGLLNVAIVGTIFASGYAVNEVTKEYDKAVEAETISTPVQNMAKDEGFNIATIPSDKDNIFTQYFTITRVMDNVVEAKNTFYENDFVFIEKTDFDKIEPKEGMKIAVTYNHDTVVTVTLAEQEKPVTPEPPKETPKEQPQPEQQKKDTPPVQKVSNVIKQDTEQKKPVKQVAKQETKQAPKNDKKQVSQEKPKVNNNLQANKPNNKTVKPEQNKQIAQDNSFKEKDEKRANTTKEYVITEDTQNKLINAENGNEKYLLENDNYKKGDKIKVTFGNSGYHDDIKKQEKVMSDEDKAYKDSFEENARTDINRNNPNYVQTEDGSFVPKDFWE
uniref:Uncharacterized protein n=1 Tax=Bacillus phage KoopaTroopa TaxID=3234046 RepID=A0AB39C7Q9_9CAUD